MTSIIEAVETDSVSYELINSADQVIVVRLP